MAENPFNWKHIVADYFTFSKSQRRAVIVFTIAIVLVVFVPAVYRYFFGTITERGDEVVIAEIKSLAVDSLNNDQERRSVAVIATGNQQADESITLFFFDPNNTSFENWQRLGVRDRTIKTIQNYLEKGGHFYKPEDLKKIYGLREEEAERLIPFIRIENREEHTPVKAYGNEKKPQENKTANHVITFIDINTADSLAWLELPGIGPKLSGRIISFRESLGGFYAVEQVGETYGLADSVFQKIKPLLRVGAGAIKKRNINTGTLQQLRNPYIPYNVANAIISYRNSHGHFTSVEELKNIPLIDEPLFKKISPYLTIE